MSLCDELLLVGRRSVAAGLLALALGWGLVLRAQQQLDLWPPAAATLVAALLGLGLLGYQLHFYWRRLEHQLQQAPLAEAPPPRPARRAAWLALPWLALLTLLSWSLDSPFFPIFAGGTLLGYGLSAPLLARRVAAIERRRITFYVIHEPQTRQRRLVRVLR